MAKFELRPQDRLVVGLRAISDYLGLGEVTRNGSLLAAMKKGGYVFYRNISGYMFSACAYASSLDIFRAKITGQPLPVEEDEPMVMGVLGITKTLGTSRDIAPKVIPLMEAENIIFTRTIPNEKQGKGHRPRTVPCSFPSLIKAFAIKYYSNHEVSLAG